MDQEFTRDAQIWKAVPKPGRVPGFERVRVAYLLRPDPDVLQLAVAISSDLSPVVSDLERSMCYWCTFEWKNCWKFMRASTKDFCLATPLWMDQGQGLSKGLVQLGSPD